jgi:hypothetical protein
VINLKNAEDVPPVTPYSFGMVVFARFAALTQYKIQVLKM